jgi:hypothetical protein
MRRAKQSAYYDGLEAAAMRQPRRAPYLVTVNRSVLTELADEWYSGYDFHTLHVFGRPASPLVM